MKMEDPSKISGWFLLPLFILWIVPRPYDITSSFNSSIFWKHGIHFSTFYVYRIKHTYILDDPFDDPPQLAELIPDASPEGRPKDEVIAGW